MDDTSLPAPEASNVPEKPKPSLHLSGSELPAELDGCQIGDRYTATVTLRVTSVNESEEGEPSKSLEVESFDSVSPAGETETQEAEETTDETEAEAPEKSEADVIGYERPNLKKPFPPVKGLRP